MTSSAMRSREALLLLRVDKRQSTLCGCEALNLMTPTSANPSGSPGHKASSRSRPDADFYSITRSACNKSTVSLRQDCLISTEVVS